MKLLVFAHTPPPHHGQSYMVKLMLDGFGGDWRKSTRNEELSKHFGIQCYHVNARFSNNLEDVGEFQATKLFLILFYCAQAIWCRFRYGVKNFYYVPAPGKRLAVYRDWLVMFICRHFFKKIILHWHAAGLGKWLETNVQIRSRAITYQLFKPVDLSIVLSKKVRADAEKFLSQKISVINYGIPDPCPDFVECVLPRRKARMALRVKIFHKENLNLIELRAAGDNPQIMKVLFLAHCMKEKGLFDTLNAVAIANKKLRQINSPIRLQLSVAGQFVRASEQMEFEARVAQPDLQIELHGKSQPAVTYLGFISGESKRKAFIENDCFCFPTFYHAESFGLVAVEAMAFGLPVVTTHWRSLPEMFPPDYFGIVPVQSPDQIAAALLKLVMQEIGENLREHFLKNFMLELYLEKLAEKIRRLENSEQNLLLRPGLSVVE
jgi:glycosyltransferase involved in cell wall biosynthesis